MKTLDTAQKTITKGSKVLWSDGFCAFYFVSKIYFENGVAYCYLRNPEGLLSANKVPKTSLVLFGGHTTFYEVLLQRLDRSYAWCENVVHHYGQQQEDLSAWINTVSGNAEAKYALCGPFTDAERVLIAFVVLVYGVDYVKDFYEHWRSCQQS